MKENSSSILIIKDAINIEDQDPDDDYLNMMKKSKINKVEKFEKYKPKGSNSKIQETNIEGAEVKVKSLLSLFLHNIETEEKKGIGSNYLFLNEIESVKKIQKLKKFEATKKINIYYDRINSNILDKKKEFSKIGISSPNLNYIRAQSLQFIIGKNTIKNKRTARKNQDKPYFYKNKRKASLIKDNIDISKAVNFKSSLSISPNHNISFIKKTKTNNLVIDNKNNLIAFKSIDINHNPVKKSVKNCPTQKYYMMKTEKEFSENKSKKKLKNFLKISNIIKKTLNKNESKTDNIQNDDSKTILKNLTEHKDEIKIEDCLKNSSLIVKNLEGSDIKSSYVNENKTNSIIRTSNISINKRDSGSPISKRSSINKSNNSNRNSLVGSLVKKKRHILTNKNFHGIMRAITSSIGINKDLIKKDAFKMLRTETVLKNLQEKLKQTIILRPEDLSLDFSEGIKPLKKKEKIAINKEKKESKNNLFSQSKLYHLKNKNELDIPKKNLNDIKKQEDISIVVQNTDINTDPINQIVFKDLLKDETQGEFEENDSQLKFIKLNEKYRIFIHRNQVYDSLDDEEIEDVVSNYIYFSPDSKFIVMFDAILLFFTLYSMFWIPFYLAHNLNFCVDQKFKFTTVLNAFIEFMNLLDLIFGFFKSYYNFEEQLIKKNSFIAKKYLTSWFTIDIISAIPFYSIFKFQEKKCKNLELSALYYDSILYNLNYLYMSNRVLKMVKVFFTNRAYKYLSNNYQEKRPFLKLIIYLIRMSCLLFVFHFCACLYIFIGRNSYPNWILYTKLEIKSFADIYICAIYMLITTLTTVGYGDITCYSFQERIFQLFLLIIGIMSYSYAVSCFSNYIKKINEKSIEFEKRKEILDDIKLNNPNLPDKLYDKIIRYLKYKNYSEKMDKNIILDCLPVGLKNNLVYEMYKPIIKNFIFFKNFENTDFIVRVILSFRPILAIKKDILINEGDIIEDIIFVKKGVLSVELPINIKNPYENVEKYLNMTTFRIEKGPNLKKVGNTTIVNSDINNNNILVKTIIGEDTKNNLIETKKDNKILSDETTYVKILNIRENEHFGDVLMFLEKRSPLRVRVRSKKAELFFLKKTDAVKISSIYQNIWSRINKKSIFNFEQIKKSIHKIVEIYCAFKIIKTLSDNNENIKKSKTYRKITRNNKHKLKLDQRIRSKSEKQILNYKNKFFNDSITETKLNSNKNIKNHSNKTINLNSDSFSDGSESDELGLEKYSYQKNNPNIKKKKPISTLLNTYNGFYKFYKGPNNKYNLNAIDSIINEEPGNESTITPFKKSEMIGLDKTLSKYNRNKISLIKHNFKKTASIQKEFGRSVSLKGYNEVDRNSNLDIYSHNMEKINEKEKLKEGEKDKGNLRNNNSSNKNRRKIKEKEIKSSEKNKFNKKKIYSSSDLYKNNNKNEFKIPSSSSNKNEDSSKINSIMNENDLTPFKKDDINEEIYPNEIFNISRKEVNLFSRKIKLTNTLNQLQNNQDSLNLNNNKIQTLLNFDKEKSSDSQNNINQIQIKNNKIENINTNFNMSKEIKKNKLNKLNIKNCCHCKRHSKTKNSSLSKKKIMLSYSIIKNTEIEYKSLYENLNQIANYKYFPNIELQNKVKNLITESSIFTSSNANTLDKKHTMCTFNKSPNLNSNEQKYETSKNPLTKLKNNFSLYHINSITNQKLKEFNNNNNKKRNNSLYIRSETFSDSPDPKNIRSTSIDSHKLEKNQFQTGVDNSFHNKNISFAGKFGIKQQKTLRNKHELEKQKINNNKNITIKKMKVEKTDYPKASIFAERNIEQKKTMKMSPNFFNKKKKGNLLLQINLNIEKTNQNLNNPEEFYTNYFNSILGVNGEKQILDTKRCNRRGSAICLSNKMIIPSLMNPKNKKKK